MQVRNVDDGLKPVARWLDAIVAAGFDPSLVFRDWVELMLMDKMNNKRRCAEILSGYEAKGKISMLFVEATAALALCLKRERRELLGELFNVYVGISVAGQGILPWEVYLVKAAMTDGLERGGVTRDLACGAGGGLAAFIRLRSVRANQCSVYAGLDEDRTCAQMTALNLYLSQVNGVAAWGDSRTREIWNAWGIFRLSMWQIMRPVPPENFTILDNILFGKVPLPRSMAAAS